MRLGGDLLIPVKKAVKRDGGVLSLGALNVAANDRSRYPLQVSQLERAIARMPRVGSVDAGMVELRIDDKGRAQADGGERYRLTLLPGRIEISGSGAAGVHYAVQTLRELFSAYGAGLPCMTVEDWPDFRRRGVMLDVSRGKVPRIRTLKTLVEMLSAWKLNELQLYVENVFKFKRHPRPSEGFSAYSAGDFLELQRHCKLHHVRLVPCLAGFGHMEKTLALPEYRRFADSPGRYNYAGGTTLNPEDPGSLRLMEELYDEFLPLFEAEDFNACCDEALLDDRDGVPASARYAKHANGLASLAARHGKRFNLWADCVDRSPSPMAHMPADAVYLDYAYGLRSHSGASPDRAHRLAAMGRNFMVCPGTSSWHAHGSFLETSTANIAQLAGEGRELRAEGLLLTDWGDSGHRQPLGSSLHSCAYAAAQAWNGAGVRTDSFTELLCERLWGDRSGRMAGALRKLGGNGAIAAGAEPARAGEWATIGKRLYFALITPFAEGISVLEDLDPRTPLRQLYESHWTPCLKMIEAEACRKIVGGRAGFGSAASSTWLPEAADFVEDLDLAESMDVLAAKRVLFAKGLACRTDRRGARALMDESVAVHEVFERNWLKRNRLSRLKDNLAVLRRNILELKGIADGD